MLCSLTFVSWYGEEHWDVQWGMQAPLHHVFPRCKKTYQTSLSISSNCFILHMTETNQTVTELSLTHRLQSSNTENEELKIWVVTETRYIFWVNEWIFPHCSEKHSEDRAVSFTTRTQTRMASRSFNRKGDEPRTVSKGKAPYAS